MKLISILVCTTVLFNCVIAADVVVNTPSGLVSGEATSGYYQFKGVPYAAPPVGDLRWKPPQSVEPWKGTKPAMKYGAACPQDCTLPPLTCPNGPVDHEAVNEDCLFVNVWSPMGAHLNSSKGGSGLLPVLYFVHGGNFRQGAGGLTLYQGNFLSNFTNHVYVSVNYRLGALGYLVTTEIDELSRGGPGFGLMDQQQGLKWVQSHITSFGGDPTRVTYFGQSAGSTSLAVHMVTPGSKGLFQAAISESNPAAIEMKDVSEAAIYGKKLIKVLECDNNNGTAILDCLKSKNSSEIVTAQNKVDSEMIPWPHTLRYAYPWAPCINKDLDDLPANPLTMFGQGKFHKGIPMIYGYMKTDARPFVFELFGKPVPKAEMEVLLAGVFELHAPKVLKAYPVPDDQKHDTRGVLTDLLTDYIFGCSQRYMAMNMAKNGQVAFLYNYTHALSFKGAWGPNYTFCEGYPCHGAELPIVFNSGPAAHYEPTPGELFLTHQMETLWAQLLDLGGKHQPLQPLPTSAPKVWPMVNATGASVLQFSAGFLEVNSAKLDAFCPMWDEIGYLKA